MNTLMRILNYLRPNKKLEKKDLYRMNGRYVWCDGFHAYVKVQVKYGKVIIRAVLHGIKTDYDLDNWDFTFHRRPYHSY